MAQPKPPPFMAINVRVPEDLGTAVKVEALRPDCGNDVLRYVPVGSKRSWLNRSSGPVAVKV